IAQVATIWVYGRVAREVYSLIDFWFSSEHQVPPLVVAHPPSRGAAADSCPSRSTLGQHGKGASSEVAFMHKSQNGRHVGRVVGLWRYPVKSMGAEALS